MYVHDLYTK